MQKEEENKNYKPVVHPSHKDHLYITSSHSPKTIPPFPGKIIITHVTNSQQQLKRSEIEIENQARKLKKK